VKVVWDGWGRSDDITIIPSRVSLCIYIHIYILAFQIFKWDINVPAHSLSNVKVIYFKIKRENKQKIIDVIIIDTGVPKKEDESITVLFIGGF
jgi:hypothetical protein